MKPLLNYHTTTPITGYAFQHNHRKVESEVSKKHLASNTRFLLGMLFLLSEENEEVSLNSFTVLKTLKKLRQQLQLRPACSPTRSYQLMLVVAKILDFLCATKERDIKDVPTFYYLKNCLREDLKNRKFQEQRHLNIPIKELTEKKKWIPKEVWYCLCFECDVGLLCVYVLHLILLYFSIDNIYYFILFCLI